MRRNLFITFFTILILSIMSLKPADAQMMGSYQNQTPPSQSDIQSEQDMQNAGLQVYQNLKSGKITCQNLTSQDFEKLGEYFMGQAAGSTENHVYWDNELQQMMGEQGDTQMHIVWGERGSGCLSNAPIPSNAPPFLNGMMNYQPSNTGGGGNNMMWGYGSNFSGFSGFGFFWILTWAVLFIDMILLGVWLWKQVRKK